MYQPETASLGIADLLVEAGKAHHAAFAATDGEDPDWPIWYAGHLQLSLNKLLETDLTRSQIVYCLMSAEIERTARAEDTEWALDYAHHFVEHFAPTQTALKDKLNLYHFEGCPFCARVRAVIARLGLDVELRDIREDSKSWDELVVARGRGTVPVLRIDSPGGMKRWMPESADIIRYLEQTYG